MFGTCLKREPSRRKKAAPVIAMGLALGIALVITVNSVSAGMTQAQDKEPQVQGGGANFNVRANISGTTVTTSADLASSVSGSLSPWRRR
ncbi:ABC transporter permease, partial [Streptomyces broussonetiae]